jgi:hypothetical protein
VLADGRDVAPGTLAREVLGELDLGVVGVDRWQPRQVATDVAGGR